MAAQSSGEVPIGRDLLTTIFKPYFLKEAQSKGLKNPDLLWTSVFDAVGGDEVLDFIWQRTGIETSAPIANRQRVLRDLRRLKDVREGRLVIHRFLVDLNVLTDGQWTASDIAQVQRDLKTKACSVYPCRSPDDK